MVGDEISNKKRCRLHTRDRMNVVVVEWRKHLDLINTLKLENNQMVKREQKDMTVPQLLTWKVA